MNLGTVHRSPGIFLTAEGNSKKTSARRPTYDGVVRPVIASNGVPFLQIMSVRSHSMTGREKEGKKALMGVLNGPILPKFVNAGISTDFSPSKFHVGKQ
jgi:hypothetical protein